MDNSCTHLAMLTSQENIILAVESDDDTPLRGRKLKSLKKSRSWNGLQSLKSVVEEEMKLRQGVECNLKPIDSASNGKTKLVAPL